MRDSRRRKPNPQVSFLDPSWIIPSNDRQDSLSIPESSASEKTPATPTSKEPVERPSSQDTAPPESQPANTAEKPTPVREKKKARYARQHSSKWLEHDVTPKSPAASLDKAEQPQTRDTATTMIPSSTQPPSSSIFRVRNSLHHSPGYDAPAISPPVSSTYSPSYGQ
ncbi:hypothetical protein BDV12DRAFT_197735 [Aspergillus spectabilis]